MGPWRVEGRVVKHDPAAPKMARRHQGARGARDAARASEALSYGSRYGVGSIGS